MSYWRGLTYNGSLLTYGDHTLAYYPSADMNPYNLPPWTIRVEYGREPGSGEPIIPSTTFPKVHVDHFGNGNVWDITIDANLKEAWFRELFRTHTPDDSPYADITCDLGDPGLTKVWGANAPGLTSLNTMFVNCHNLREVCIFDTRYVTSWTRAFSSCTSLKSIPRFDVFEAKYMLATFSNCFHVEHGALDLYNDASSTGLVTDHRLTFHLTGRYSTTGSAEVEQIPDDWKNILV